MVASLYDASLDQFAGHGFPGISGIFRGDTTYVHWGFSNRREEFDRVLRQSEFLPLRPSRPTYAHFPDYVEQNLFFYAYPGAMRTMARMDMPEGPVPAPTAQAEQADKAAEAPGGIVGGVIGGVAEKKAAPEIDLSEVQARKNLNETAFFFPHLLTDGDGTVTLEFKMPEALTHWRFLGFAHTKGLESGSLGGEAVTQKELMVQPNPPALPARGRPPRVHRQGDES